MTSVDVSVETPIVNTARVRQLEALFDVPRADVARLSWSGRVELPEEWHVGLVTGPSGSGKTTVSRHLWGEPLHFSWSDDRAVVDDFDPELPMDRIAAVCQAVGFNTIPAWTRPYRVLSTGEKFRVEIARRLLETLKPVILVDEFTSVVDRQVAQAGSHAIQKHVRKHGRKLVAVTVHRDVVEWLQPDWVLELPGLHLARRDLRRRPELHVEVRRVGLEAWALFAPFHYLRADINQNAQCFVLFVGDTPTSFVSYVHRPHATAGAIKGMHRWVTLPDWQGLGLGPFLIDTVASAVRATGARVRTYAAHPAGNRILDRSANWALAKKPGVYSPAKGKSSSTRGVFGGRPCAVWEYVGPVMERGQAECLLAK
jgi:ABC-type ATPase involved in cell division